MIVNSAVPRWLSARRKLGLNTLKCAAKAPTVEALLGRVLMSPVWISNLSATRFRKVHMLLSEFPPAACRWRHFSSFMSPFQGRVACQNLPQQVLTVDLLRLEDPKRYKTVFFYSLKVRRVPHSCLQSSPSKGSNHGFSFHASRYCYTTNKTP